MGKWDKLRQRILLGEADSNVPFADLCHLLRRCGFEERIAGSHHIFYQPGVEEILNLQPKDKLAKTYQVGQVRQLLLKYSLGAQTNE
jgi:predicted RNA binding protein YcfA (HicA-like mRNA interferase family)